MNRLRLELPALALGEMAILEHTDDTCLLTRALDGKALYIAVNFSSKEARELLVPQRLTLLGALDTDDTASAAVSGARGTLVSLPPYGIAFLGME